MKHLFRIYILVFMLTSDFKVFADDGPGDDSDDNLEGDDDPAVPINGKLIILLVVGLLFAYYKFKTYQKVTTQE